MWPSIKVTNTILMLVNDFMVNSCFVPKNIQKGVVKGMFLRIHVHKQPSIPSRSLPRCPSVVSLEGRAAHLATLVREAEQRVAELRAQVGGEGPAEREASDRERQLKAWEWRLRLFRRMQTGFEHASKASAAYEQPSLVFIFRSNSFLGRVNGFHTGKASARLCVCVCVCVQT